MKFLIVFVLITIVVNARLTQHRAKETTSADCSATGSTTRRCLPRSQAHGSGGRYRTVNPVIDSPSIDGHTQQPICGGDGNEICVELCCHSGNAEAATCTVASEFSNRYAPNGYHKERSLGCCPSGEICVAKGAAPRRGGSSNSGVAPCTAAGGDCRDISGGRWGWLGRWLHGCPTANRRSGLCPGPNTVVCCVF